MCFPLKCLLSNGALTLRNSFLGPSFLLASVMCDDGSVGSRVTGVKLSADTQPVSVLNWCANVWD